MAVYTVKQSAKILPLVRHLVEHGGVLDNALARELMGVHSKQVHGLLATAIDRGLVQWKLEGHGFVYWLADNVVITPSNTPGRIDIYIDGQQVDYTDDELEFLKVRRSWIRLGDQPAPMPFTLAPASVFHLGGAHVR